MKKEITIEKNIPIPPFSITGKKHAHLLSMEIGDSFFVDKEDILSTRSIVAYYKRKFGKKYCTRSENEGIRCWRIE